MTTTTSLSLGDKFEELRKRYASFCICRVQAKINQARDKDFARQEYLPSLMNFNFNKIDGYEGKIMELFDYNYRLGISVDEILVEILDDIQRKLREIDEFTAKWGDKIKDFDDENRQSINKELFLDRRESLITFSNIDALLRVIVQNYGFSDLRDHFKAEVNNEEILAGEYRIESHQPVKVEWTGDERSGKLDFIKLIYGLHYAGLLNHGNGEITKIVENLAYHLNVKLGKGWMSSLSRNRQERNYDYNHFRVFEEIKEGFAKYIEKKDNKS